MLQGLAKIVTEHGPERLSTLCSHKSSHARIATELVMDNA